MKAATAKPRSSKKEFTIAAMIQDTKFWLLATSAYLPKLLKKATTATISHADCVKDESFSTSAYTPLRNVNVLVINDSILLLIVISPILTSII